MRERREAEMEEREGRREETKEGREECEARSLQATTESQNCCR